MNSSMVMIHLQRGKWWWVRDHANERSVCRRRIAVMEGIRGLPIATILRGHSNSCHHQIIYLQHADGDARLDCWVCHALELQLGVAPHFQGEDPMAKEGTDHPQGTVRPRSFRSLIASSNKGKCYGFNRVSILDHDFDVLGCNRS